MSDAARPVQHETPELSTRRVVAAVAALFALVALSLGLVALLLDVSIGRVSNLPVSVPSLPAPSLQIVPDADLAQMRQREHARVFSFRVAKPVRSRLEHRVSWPRQTRGDRARGELESWGGGRAARCSRGGSRSLAHG